MMLAAWTKWTSLGKKSFLGAVLVSAAALSACSTNPATGEQQFTALLPAEKEASVGASEHQKVRETFGEFIGGDVGAYVNRVGQKVAANTERPDVKYKFFVLDSPMVNAFAIPGGYIYLSRGLLDLANSESEVAGVLAHEIGHITGRHSAERMSQGFLVGLGAAILGAAAGDKGVSQAANIGSDLYIKSYSRGQEHQADELGVRYLHRAGYDPKAMAVFLSSLDQSSKLDQKISGQQSGFSYFSTHPQTADRVAEARAEAASYSGGPSEVGRDAYLNMVDGLVYGDSAAQGFVRGNDFYHTKIGFMFSVPQGFNMQNTPNQVVATDNSGAVVVFDSAGDPAKRDPLTYLTQGWLKGEPVSSPENITINGMKAATASFKGTVQNRPVTIRVVAVEWKPGQFFRFQMAIPSNASASVVEGLKKTTYSFRHLSSQEMNTIQPKRIKVVTAAAGDTVASLSARMAVEQYKEDHFRVLNALAPGQNVTAGQRYKIVVQ